MITKYARQCKAIVTVEEHQVNAGIGSAIAEVVVKSFPVPIEMVGMNDSFGESGEPKELLAKYSMDAKAIGRAVAQVLKRKS
ncbi:transketolase family protein, partial [Candidatus Falkowbacteria bacterium]|nr:transketolase family protein [Candidatus Falkowbacteria bacterium]